MTARPRGASAHDDARPHPPWAGVALGALAWAALGALLVALLGQIPARHPVDVGRRDAAYVQGFHEPEPAGAPELAGSDGNARWSRASSALLFPQAGLPGSVTVRLRGPGAGEPVEVVLLLNGAAELARAQAGDGWVTVAVPVTAGVLKATDFFIELRAPTTALPDGREVGVLVDQALYTVGPGPVTPYPTQLIYGALMGALGWLLVGRRATGRGRAPLLRPAAYLAAYGAAWLILYRLQPPLYPHPLRALPLWAVGGAAALLALRDGPALAARRPWLIAVAAPVAAIAAWTAATLLVGQGHVTLSRPGVENDFRVFATRESLGQVFSADGFYNLGYPLLLWLARPLFDGNAFLAGRLVAALSGAAMLAAGYWLARSLLPPGPALAALAALALSGLVAQYGLYVGSDMPFAACAALCVAASVAGARERAQGGAGRALLLAGLAGACGGAAFLMRHLGLVLLPWGVVALLLGRAGRRAAAVYGAAFLLVMAPQVAVNLAQAGDPLYNQQAKNIWLAVYGGTDWGRWDEAPNAIGLAEVVLQDPGRFFDNWWRNVVAYLGSGAEDTSEFGRALQLRLLGFPANWLAVGALLAWLVGAARARPGWWRASATGGAAAGRPGADAPAAPERRTRRDGLLPAGGAALVLLIGGYVAAVSTAFTLQRFFLPLAPLYAAAAGWALWRLARGGRALLGATLVVVMVLWGGYGAGARYVLANQPADEVAIVAMVEGATPPEALLAARVAARLPIAKYSAIAHRVVDWPVGADTQRPITAADLDDARRAGASYLLWDEAAGPPPLADPEAARAATTGRYGLYRLDQPAPRGARPYRLAGGVEGLAIHTRPTRAATIVTRLRGSS